MDNTNLLNLIETEVEFLNEIVHLGENPTEHAKTELNALVNAHQILNGELATSDQDVFYKSFFKNHDKLEYKSDLMKMTANRLKRILSETVLG